MSTKKRLITNFLSLASVQGLNFILPLVTLPYLLLVLGPNKYGLVSFAQAFIQYFIIFTDYGFNLLATRDISIARNDKQKLSTIFSNVMVVKLILLIMSLVILIILLILVPKFKHDSLIYIYTFGMVVGNVLLPTWFFQGIEEMKVISILNIIAKTIFTLGIFVFVKEQSQYLYVPIFNSLGYISIGLIGIYLVIFRYRIHFSRPSVGDIVQQLNEGWHIFFSTMLTSVYTTSNVFVLGFFANNTVVGYYSSAERIIKAILSVITPIVQTLYPFLSNALQESKEKTIALLNKIFIFITVFMLLLSLVVGFFAKPIVDIALGTEYEPIIPLLQILSVLPLILGWANVFSTLTMVNFDYKKQLSQIYLAASTLSIILMIILIPNFKEYGTAWIAVITETFATMLMAVFLWKKGIHIWKFKKKASTSKLI